MSKPMPSIRAHPQFVNVHPNLQGAYGVIMPESLLLCGRPKGGVDHKRDSTPPVKCAAPAWSRALPPST